MISLDTNVLARFYVDDPDDPEALRQRPAARAAMAQPALFVPLTVMLELEWVMRAFYGFTPAQFARVVKHLAGLPHVSLEAGANVLAALQDHLQGLDFADALHLRASSQCRAMFSFDERRFARKAKRLGLVPAVVTPSA
jgi:predicted nucleic-acid-binding protein